MYSEGLKLIEKAQLYLAFGLLILGHSLDFQMLLNIAGGLFLGMATAFFMAWRANFKTYKR